MSELGSRQVNSESGSFASKKPKFVVPSDFNREPEILNSVDAGEVGFAILTATALLLQVR